jgi:hypothetical protein
VVCHICVWVCAIGCAKQAGLYNSDAREEQGLPDQGRRGTVCVCVRACACVCECVLTWLLSCRLQVSTVADVCAANTVVQVADWHLGTCVCECTCLRASVHTPVCVHVRGGAVCVCVLLGSQSMSLSLGI